MWKIAKCDNETKRLLRLAIPFTCSAMIETVSDLVILVIIAQYIGTDSSVAFAMVDLLVGISSEFNGGWIEAVSSLCSQAYGTSNYELAGEMVQASCIAYVLGELIFASIWLNLIDTIIRLMGFDETVVTLAKEYVPVQISLNIIMGITETILDFLEVVEKEKFANMLYCLISTLEVGLVATFAIKADANLTTVGLLMLACESLLLFLCILIPSQMGWLRRFEFGLFNKCSLRNITMLKQLFKVALPLAFGSVLAYAEWEFLTFFAAALGPAEAATWAILGFVWDVFESTTEAIGDASEVRCAYQLGKGRPELAKISAYKSTFLSSIVAMVVTTIFLGLSDYLPSWLTQDQTIQNMLSELFPLMALGNITMNMGMVCWAVIGAQGRYRLSTCVAFACSFFITIPLGAIFTLWLEVNLQGLTFAVVVGYTMTAMLLSTILLISDWEMLATQIQEKMRAEEDSVDSDSSSSSSSSSSRHSHIEDRSSHALAQSNVITGDTSEISIAMRDEVSPLPKTTGSLDLVRTPPRKNKDTGPQPHQSPESVSDLSFDSTLVSRDSTTRPMIGPSPTVLDEEQASSIENDNIVDSCQHESSFDLDGSPVSRTWNSSTTSQRSQRTPGSPHTRRAHQPPHVGSPDHSTSVNDNSLNSWPHNDMIGESRVVKGRRKRIG
jgi:MATE family multidrug resistance protein